MTHGEWANQTLLHPYGMSAVLVLGFLMLVLPRMYATIPMLILACFIPSSQRLVVATLDFSLLRILVLFGWVRIVFRNELKQVQLNKIDLLVICWMVTQTVVYTLLHLKGSAFINRAGVSFEALGTYFLYRCLVKEWKDIEIMVRTLAILAIPVSVFFFIENGTGRNYFSNFGGVPAFSIVRHGSIRAQGAFTHPIMAGCFWSVSVPLIAVLWRRGGFDRILSFFGISGCVVAILSTSSGTPIIGLLLVLVGAAFYILRGHMHRVMISFLGGLIFLHMVMKGPVWSLLGKAGNLTGSTGWHRVALIDGAVNNFHKWFLLGTRDTGSWGVYLRDITNHFILEGVRGGFLSMCIFIAIFYYSFKMVGKIRPLYSDFTYRQYFVWALGVCMFIHCANFMAVSYFGQIFLILYIHMAIFGSLLYAYTEGNLSADGGDQNKVSRHSERVRYADGWELLG